MPTIIMGFSVGSMTYKQPEKLAEALGFVGLNEMKTFIAGPRFHPLFEQYAEICIYPQQLMANQIGSSRKRGPSIAVIEKRIIAGERTGSDKFSSAFPDKTDWDHTDHCAYMIYQLKLTNTKNANGLFYGKGLTDSQILDQLWGLVKYEEYNHAPARQRKKPYQDSQKPGPSQSAGPSQPAGPSQAADPSQLPMPKPSADNLRIQSGTSNSEAIDLTAEDDDLMRLDPQPEIVSSFEKEIKFEPNADEDSRRPILLDDDIDEDSFFGSALTLTNAQRVAAENQSSTFDITQRFWQIWTIDKLIEAEGSTIVMQDAMLYVSDQNRMANAESETWFKAVTHAMSQDTIIYQPYTEEAAQAFDTQQEYFDNLDYQREDLEASCKLLGIPWAGDATIFRMPGMALSQELRYWQPVAIKALIDFTLNRYIRGCILGDVMGLGKTWVVVCYLLWLIQLRRRQPVHQRRVAKPVLVLVPLHIMNQWIRAVDLIAPGVFTVYKYHGDARGTRFVPIANERGLDRLTRDHALFNGNEQNAHAIIFSNIHTWNERHGPKAQGKFFRNTSMSKKPAKNENKELNPDWEGGLADCFRLVIVDEAQVLKSMAAGASLSVSWLNACFHVLVSATPTPNGISDWIGYMPFIESSQAESWWEEKYLAAMKWDEDLNPFAVKDDHPAAKLQLTTKAVKDWILRISINPLEKGQRMAQIWKKVLIRRTHSSRIPFNSTKTIGEDLPRIQGAFINCKQTEAERTIYKESEAKALKLLMYPSSDKSQKPTWSLSTHRELCLLSMATYLPRLDVKFDLKASNLKKTFENRQFYVPWFAGHGEVDLCKPTPYLQDLVHGSPKIRALLRNVRSQVIRDREKVLIWCQLPAVTVLLFAVFRLLHIEVVTITAFQKSDERDAIVDMFNNDDSKAMVLIMTYAVGSTGLNLQQRCWRVHLIESAHNMGHAKQAIGRARRLGNPSPVVYVYEYYVADTFDDKAIWRNIEKAIPEAMAELNRQIFNGGDESKGELDLGDWVLHNGVLTKLEDATAEEDEVLHILSPHELLQEILMATKGERTEV